MSVLHGKTAIVTGGSRGIGRAIVERLVRDGATVVFSYAANRTAADEVAAATGALPVRADLTDPDAVVRLLDTALDHLGDLDILVANAAAPFPVAPLAETTLAVFDEVMTANARSTFIALQYAARHLRDDGRVVVISSVNTVRPAPGIAPYAASKGAVEQLVQVAALELGGRGITVNTVSPGATDTDLFRDTNPPEAYERVAAVTALGRVGAPADIADVVGFLAGPDARWVTGQNLRATGGLV
ncbi:SDR family oxidoreductase [Actinocorallia lasiicapitis]